MLSGDRAWWRHPVWAAIVRRALLGAFVVAAVATLSFALIHLAPGDPLSVTLDNPHVSAGVRAQWRANYGLDLPLGQQYVRYVGLLARGDFGYSYSMREPVGAVLARVLPNTLLLMGVALVLSFALGIAVGALQAAHPGGVLDRVAGGLSLVLFSMPDFWLALLAMLSLAYWLPIFPVSGMIDAVMHPYMTPAERVVDRLRHLVLPSLTLTLVLTAGIARFQRAALADVLRADYVRTARAKGVREREVVGRHGLRNALLPVITLVGLAFPALLGGAVFVERVFAWPGMGWTAVNAVSTRDYPLVVASVIVGSVMVVVGSALADALYALADPRLRSR